MQRLRDRCRRPLCQILPLAAAMALGLVASCQKRISTNSIRTVDTATLAQWLESRPERYLVVDARRQESYDAAHIAGARWLDFPEVDAARPRREWQRYGAIVVYGDNPGSIRAEAMTKRFLEIDPTQIYLLEGGFDAWKSQGLPVGASSSTDGD